MLRLKGQRQIHDTRYPQIWRRKTEAGGGSAGLRQEENCVFLLLEAEEGSLREKAHVWSLVRGKGHDRKNINYKGSEVGTHLHILAR